MTTMTREQWLAAYHALDAEKARVEEMFEAANVGEASFEEADSAGFDLNEKYRDLVHVIAEILEPTEVDGTPDRVRDSCGCGMEIVWTGEGWQHDCAPYFHGDDHFIDTPEPDPEDPARKYWDIEDGVREEDEN